MVWKKLRSPKYGSIMLGLGNVKIDKIVGHDGKSLCLVRKCITFFMSDHIVTIVV